MNSEKFNASTTSLFINGGRMDILFEDADRPLEETNERFIFRPQLIKECPCGCGLKNNVCDARAAAVKRINDEIGF